MPRLQHRRRSWSYGSVESTRLSDRERCAIIQYVGELLEVRYGMIPPCPDHHWHEYYMETLSPLADRSLKTLEKVDNGLWKKSIRRSDTFRWVVEFPAERIWEKLDMSLADLMHINEEWHTCKFRWMWRSPKKLYNPVEGYDGVMPLHPEHPHTEWMIETAAELQALAFQNRAASYWLDRLVWQMNTWGQCKAVWPAIVNYVPNWKREAIERLHKKSRLPDIDKSLLKCIKKGLSTVTDMALTQALLLPEGKERQITMLFEDSKHPQARMHKD